MRVQTLRWGDYPGYMVGLIQYHESSKGGEPSHLWLQRDVTTEEG